MGRGFQRRRAQPHKHTHRYTQALSRRPQHSQQVTLNSSLLLLLLLQMRPQTAMLHMPPQNCYMCVLILLHMSGIPRPPSGRSDNAIARGDEWTEEEGDVEVGGQRHEPIPRGSLRPKEQVASSDILFQYFNIVP